MTDGHLKEPKARTINTYIPTKKGKITIPRHGGDLNIKTAKTILKQAGLE